MQSLGPGLRRKGGGILKPDLRVQGATYSIFVVSIG